ncbi:alanine dehydrogenase [Engelhardtia mirabilis]|uniref:Alanine dehydrogenase n=1 Tax=Engelhardtia mirabilis TaxID=2528011 RepID=A0A518BKA5_9BACT|nr:Alanine dehydrogenase [Planctomycetes bacterium Pla133]QDV01724.1 Alanine dehydrogenase [Planctomycetes bacterium Pla86]
MKIGVPTEIKPQENRIALTPAGADRLVAAGHQVYVQSDGGLGSGFDDSAYELAGATIVSDADSVFGESDLILKVKEPLKEEWARIRKGQTLFTYFHLAADRVLTEGLMATGAHCFAYETLEVGRTLPLLTPMSEVAGRMSIQAGAHHLEKAHGGSGILLGGVPGVKRAKVLVIGGGVVGINAARMACGLGADVTIMDVNLDRLRYLDEVMPANCRTVHSSRFAIREHLNHVDLVIGAVLIPGAAAPKLVHREDLELMGEGSVIVDVAVDQGGCVETCKPTTHANPTFVVDGVVHYCVANMPGAVPRTSTLALTNATLSYTLELARLGGKAAVEQSAPLRTAANIIGGQITCKAVGEAFGMASVDPAEAYGRLA